VDEAHTERPQGLKPRSGCRLMAELKLRPPGENLNLRACLRQAGLKPLIKQF